MTADQKAHIEENITTTFVQLRIEHLRDAFGIGMDRPRLSWTVHTSRQGWYQTAYEIEAYDDGKLRDQTGKIDSDRSVLVAWPFEPLASRERISLRVRVWGNDGDASEWSETVLLETGLLSTSDWTAQFI